MKPSLSEILEDIVKDNGFSLGQNDEVHLLSSIGLIWCEGSGSNRQGISPLAYEASATNRFGVPRNV